MAVHQAPYFETNPNEDHKNFPNIFVDLDEEKMNVLLEFRYQDADEKPTIWKWNEIIRMIHNL